MRVPVAIATALLCAAVVAISLAGAPADERLTTAVVFGLLVAAPMIVGLVALDVHPDDRFARLLIAAGAVFSLTALSQSGNDVLYSVGRVAVWLVVPVLLYLMLSFPSGRLVARRDRRLMTGVWALAAILYLPTALIVDHFPEPSPWARCGVDCPSNAFALVARRPAIGRRPRRAGPRDPPGAGGARRGRARGPADAALGPDAAAGDVARRRRGRRPGRRGRGVPVEPPRRRRPGHDRRARVDLAAQPPRRRAELRRRAA